MAEKGQSPETTSVTPDDLRMVAELIRRYSNEYDDAAAELESAGIARFPATGLTALKNNVLRVLAGNAATLQKKIQIEVDARKLALLAEDPTKYVVDPPHKRRSVLVNRRRTKLHGNDRWRIAQFGELPTKGKRHLLFERLVPPNTLPSRKLVLDQVHLDLVERFRHLSCLKSCGTFDLARCFRYRRVHQCQIYFLGGTVSR